MAADSIYEQKLIDTISLYLTSTDKRDGQGSLLYVCPLHDHSQPEPDLALRINDQGFAVWWCYGRGEGGGIRDLFKTLSVDLPEKSTSLDDVRYKQIEDEYVYTDHLGQPVHKVVRFAGKHFKQQKWNKQEKKWEWGVKGIKYLLYRTDRLFKFVKNDCFCFIVEGEKDVDRLTKEGLLATTNAMGASSPWREHYTAFLLDYDVVIIPDNDEPGIEHAYDIATAIHGKVKSVRILHLPLLKEKGDVSDWLDVAGNTVDVLQQMAATTPLYTPSVQQAAQKIKQATATAQQKVTSSTPATMLSQNYHPLTDAGNAEQFLDDWGDSICYCPNLKSWLIWNGNYWKIDEGSEIMNYALKTIRNMRDNIPWDQAVTQDDKDYCSMIHSHSVKCESTAKLLAMLEQAKSKRWISYSDLDTKESTQWYINLKNCMIDLRTMTIVPPSKDLFITRQVPVDYDESATCPQFEKFVNDFACGRSDLVSFLQKALGASLPGNNRMRHIYILHGQQGKNGKSTLMEIISGILGQDYSCKFNSTLLIKSRFTGGEELTPGMARLKGKRFVYASELDEAHTFNIAKIKEFTGEDTLSVNPKNRPQFEFAPEHTPWIMTNPMPRIDGTDRATFDRIKMIPCEFRVEDGCEDLALKSKLLSEAPGIFNWLLRGCSMALADGITAPDSVTTATLDYRSDNDPVGVFLLTSGFVKGEEGITVSTGDLLDAYIRWGEGQHFGKQQFRNQMNRMARCVDGVELKWNKKLPICRDGGWSGLRIVKTGDRVDADFEDDLDYDYIGGGKGGRDQSNELKKMGQELNPSKPDPELFNFGQEEFESLWDNLDDI